MGFGFLRDTSHADRDRYAAQILEACKERDSAKQQFLEQIRQNCKRLPRSVRSSERRCHLRLAWVNPRM
jgi:hypothetical protein